MKRATVNATSPAAQRAVRYAQFTIGYNIIEGVVALSAGLAASAVSLIGFGVDSGIEVAAAAVVLLRLTAAFRADQPNADKERQAIKLIALTFYALAIYLVVEGVRDLITAHAPDTSIVGIVLTSVSVVVMPLLARAKRRAGQEMKSRLVVADAAETKLCAWLSVSTLAGLVGYALIGWNWIDAVAGFVIACFAIWEGKETWERELAEDGGE